MSGLFGSPTAVLLLILLVLPLNPRAAPAVRFFAFGDLPYSPAEMRMLESLLADVRDGRPDFLVHVGDVKGGNVPCTDRELRQVADLFKVQSVPVVYTPGDNEWTDCHRAEAGGYDPVERLGTLRSIYYGNPDVLRLHELGAIQPDASYPENYWFVRGGVFFATLHLVGSHNNLNPGDAAAVREHRARSKVNRGHLERAVQAANAANASAFVLVFQANAGLEKARPPRGYDRFQADLRRLLQDFSGPVLAIHGDTHKYRFDHPWKDSETGRVLQRFTRLEVPGSPRVAGVWVSVDSDAEEPFSVELDYPDSREHLIE